MKLVIQRCQEASVSVAGETVGTIQNGLMVLIGVGKDDTEEIADCHRSRFWTWESPQCYLSILTGFPG